MYCTFKREDVIQGLTKAIGIVPLKAGASYLRSLWIEAKDDSLSIMATDASTEFTGKYKAQVTTSGNVGVNAKVFVDLINKLPQNSTISLNYDNDKKLLHVEQGKSSYKLSTADPLWFKPLDEYPEENSVLWSGDFFQEVIDKTYFCIADDETTEQLSCFFMKKIQDRIDCCGLNGHQLAVVNLVNEELANLLPENGLLIQKKSVSELKKWLIGKDIELNITDSKVFFRNDEKTEVLSFKRAFYNYPNHTVFLDRLKIENPSILTIDRKEMLEALNRISLFNSELEKSTFFTLSQNTLELSAKGQEVGSGKEVIEVEYNGSIEQIAFATRQIRDILENFISEKVTFCITGTESPCGVTGEQDVNYNVIVMPVKIAQTSVYDD